MIDAFTTILDTKALGYLVEAIVRIRPLPGKLHVVEQMLREMPEVTECDKVTGDDGFVARILSRSIEHLDEQLEKIGKKAETSSAIVKRKIASRRQPDLLS
ncbi:Lrp/AsnC family transcriptional regulator [Sphingomonas sp. QA11]|uniref:Lrp/AsnC family transcriptional regulator n=1 Tax=Sphingomonas sp. QA11 TaxID=2950605 RepID=UPI0023491D0C|nr:Lrp/AsnC family transcriptional regulator [Sphingomonas sp. QA11]WCM27390.1 Lrp/AsnC family transcriptional regulator [Sphingomonas sp. QA11]